MRAADQLHAGVLSEKNGAAKFALDMLLPEPWVGAFRPVLLEVPTTGRALGGGRKLGNREPGLLEAVAPTFDRLRKTDGFEGKTKPAMGGLLQHRQSLRGEIEAAHGEPIHGGWLDPKQSRARGRQRKSLATIRKCSLGVPVAEDIANERNTNRAERFDGGSNGYTDQSKASVGAGKMGKGVAGHGVVVG